MSIIETGSKKIQINGDSIIQEVQTHNLITGMWRFSELANNIQTYVKL